MRLLQSPLVAFASGAIVLATLAACGGGDAAAPAAPVVAPTALTGSVAIGAPITQGVLKVVDAAGNVVADGVAVADDGSYPAVELTGTGPWRLEACGYAGANWRCMYTVAQSAGTANVTPLTSALIALASGQPPESMLQAGAAAPAADQLAAAQSQLQAGLAGTLADAGVSATLDFTTGALAAGTRSGYDRVLDAVAVTTGNDAGAFVQVTPRLGDGNLYLTTGATSGTITSAPGAAALPLGGLETLFTTMSDAMVGAAACGAPNGGIASSLASDARMNLGDGRATGRDAVAAGLCRFFGSGDDGSTPIWGARLVSPTLGHCDFTGADPLCAVSFVLQDAGGAIENVGGGMAVVYRAGAWQFYGDLLPIQINANAAVQRNQRVDDATTPLRYGRALQFDISVTPGVQCVQISQRDAGGSPTTVAYFKVHSPDAVRMSLWTLDGQGNQGSLDPNAGSTRSTDDSWLGLPSGTDGDAVVRNFYRGGRTVIASIYADTACSAPAVLEGKSEFMVDVDGVPPVWAEMPALAWGDLSAAAKSALAALALDVGSTASFDAAWSFTDGETGFDGSSFCTSGSCAEGSDVRLGEKSYRPDVRSFSMPLKAPVAPLHAGDFKMLVLGGRDGSGMNIESEFTACTGSPAGGMCFQ